MKEQIQEMCKRYQDMNPVVKAGFAFTLCNVLQRGIQFLITPIYTRVLSTEQYGEYSLFITWMDILLIFGTLNLSAGFYYNGLIKNERETYRYTSSLELLSTLSTIVIFLIIWGLYIWLPALLNMSASRYFLMFLFILVQPALGFWTTQHRIKYDYKPVIFITLLGALFAPLVGIICFILSDANVFGLLLGFVLVNVLINGTLYVRNLILGKAYFSLSEWKTALSFSIPLIPHYLSMIILAQFDRIMIDYYCGRAKAGIYTLAYQIGMALTILISGINNAFTPWMYQQIKKKDYRNIRRATSFLVFLLVILNILVVLIAPEIISFLGTSEYQDAVWIIPPVALSMLVTFIYCAFGTVLFYFEDTKRVSLATASGAVLDLVLNAVFIPRYGFIAAGYTTLASYLLILFVYYFFIKKCCRENEIKFSDIFNVRLLAFFVMLSGGIAAVSLCVYQYWFLRYFIIAVTLALLFFAREKIITCLKAVFQK